MGYADEPGKRPALCAFDEISATDDVEIDQGSKEGG
jgi:hypothetical protein